MPRPCLPRPDPAPVWGSWFRVQGAGCRVQGAGCRGLGLTGPRVEGFEFEGLGFGGVERGGDGEIF